MGCAEMNMGVLGSKSYNGPHAELTRRIIGCAIEVHKELGPGLLESAYEACLVHLLVQQDIAVARQVELPVSFQGQRIDAGFRMDLVVESVVVVEIKAVDELHPIHEAQLLTYLKLSKLSVGLLINFNTLRLVDGIKRLVNTSFGSPPSSPPLLPHSAFHVSPGTST